MNQKIKGNLPIIILILLSSLGVIAGSFIAPIEVRFIQSLTHNPILIGLTFSIGTFFMFIFSLYLGRKSVVIGKRRILFIGLLTGLFYPLIYATSLTVFQYMFGRVAWALACVASGTMINALFQDIISKRKNIAELSGWYYSVRSIAGTVGAVAGGFIADFYGLLIPYYLVIAAYLISLALFLSFMKPMEEEKSNVEPQKISVSLKDIISNPFLFLRFFTEGITQSHWVMEPILFPLILYAMTGTNAATGVVFGAMGVLAMISNPLAGKLIDKTSPITGLKIAFILYTFSLLFLSLSRNFIPFIIGAVILSLGKTFNGPSMNKIETENIKNEYRGEYLSYFNIYDVLTGTLAAFIVGVLLVYFTPHQILFLFAIFTAVGFIGGMILFKMKLEAKK
ncbi:MAG: hypothetical protein DRP06_01830 [Candidatus Aenigmatarchaeota archaeon]|nr:MAG: hypothetical protein DRP06_01830 [Candidatus Aenigmarchaeota archaeon]